MNNVVNMLKENKDIPDFYTIDIEFITGGDKKYEVVGHKYPIANNVLLGFIEMILSNETVAQVPIGSIKELTFGKDFVKFITAHKAKEDK